MWHVECFLCRIATAPTHSRAIAESRWHWQEPLVLLSDIGAARAALSNAA
ncbi:hypothetical protein [Lysobacter enzymogenes]|nr:hypothetical protein [Lysobacter enzymogenes]UZW62728.1 hypothetical protein BV903_010735 [Lysobacter enzymogenes]